jgi:hypothetical protein
MADFHCVYILASEPAPGRPHVGVTRDLSKRLAAHNAGKSPHTAKVPALENQGRAGHPGPSVHEDSRLRFQLALAGLRARVVPAVRVTPRRRAPCRA